MMLAVAKGIADSDVFHLRSPGNISLVASLVAPLLARMMHKHVCAKYAGQWPAYPGEPFSYRLQKSLLRSGWFNGPVTVYGQWPGQPAHIKPFFTSVMDREQMRRAVAAARTKSLHAPVRIVFVGRLTRSKNVHILLEALRVLESERIPFACRIIGDGPERQALEAQAGEFAQPTCITFTGGIPFEEVLDAYAWADVLVLASATEGWPKAVAEGMAFGLACIGSNHGLVTQMLAEGRGFVVEPGNAADLAAAIKRIAGSAEVFLSASQSASAWSSRFTLDGLRAALGDLLAREFQLPAEAFSKS